MNTIQKEIKLSPKERGFHLITSEITNQLSELKKFEFGILNLSIMHTSASICLNECADPEVRTDMEKYFNHTVPEMAKYFEHTYEGPDDMPAHIKSVLVGNRLNYPYNKW